MRLQHLAVLAGCALWSAGASAQPSPDLTAQQLDALFAAVNNVGRWGTDDARGTLNHITAELRVAAAREARTGRTVSLSRQLEPGEEPGALEPMAVTPFGLESTGRPSWTVTYAVQSYSPGIGNLKAHKIAEKPIRPIPNRRRSRKIQSLAIARISSGAWLPPACSKRTALIG